MTDYTALADIMHAVTALVDSRVFSIAKAEQFIDGLAGSAQLGGAIIPIKPDESVDPSYVENAIRKGMVDAARDYIGADKAEEIRSVIYTWRKTPYNFQSSVSAFKRIEELVCAS